MSASGRADVSQLFDRIRGLAGCDRVEIVLVADHAHADARTALQLADSLARAAQVPQLTVWVLPTCEQHALRPLQHIERVDLPDEAGAVAVATIARLLTEQGSSRNGVLRVRGRTAALLTEHDATLKIRTVSGPRDPYHRWIVATDEAGHDRLLRHLSRGDLGVSIGGVAPSAELAVADLTGFIAIIDALVDARGFAFGVGNVMAAMSSSETLAAPSSWSRRSA
jgi:hypothetical protein